MTYSAGGLIEASDYNSFVGGSSANVSGQLNTVYSTGYGNAGYGQPGIANVSVAGIVTAAEWTTLVNGVNAVRKHQSGAGFTNLSLYAAGDTINATQDVSSNLTSAYSNRLTLDSYGATQSQPTQTVVFSAPNDTNPQSFAVSRTVSFANADATRYFFNAGGNVTLVVGTITNTGGTSRGASLANVISAVSGKGMTAGAMSGITVSAPLSQDIELTTNYGYYGQTTSNLTVSKVSGSSYGAVYDAQYANLVTKVSGTAGSNGDNGNLITISIEAYSPAQSPAEGDSIDISIDHELVVNYPSTTYIGNTWGSATFG